MKSVQGDEVVRELEAIKRLLMLMLMRAGATQADIAAALGVNQSSVSRMLPRIRGKVTNAKASK